MTRYADPDLDLTDAAVDDHTAGGLPPAPSSAQVSVPEPTRESDHV